MRVRVVGAAPAWSLRPGQPSSCYLVDHADEAVVLDLGQGSLGALAALRDPSTLRAVVISHLHPDHHVDLVALRHLLRYGYEEERRVELHAPAGLRQRYDDFLGEAGFLDGLPGPELAVGSHRLGSLELEVAEVTHAAPSFAFRISPTGDTGAPGLVYSGDLGRADDLLPLVRTGDTLLCEAFWGTREGHPEAHHLTAREAAGVAARSAAGRLVLTHIAEAYDPAGAVVQAAAIFAGPVQLARPDLLLSFA